MISKRALLIFILFLSFFGLTHETFATFDPGSTIQMTGSTTDARFDVAEALFSSGIVGQDPLLDTVTHPTPTFSGSFYINDIGWVMFNTGVFRVELSCTDFIDNLSSNCILTGSGWSEIAGEVGFQGVEYLWDQGVLSGSVTTFAGDFSLSGIYLPLLPVALNETLSNLTATSALTLTVSGASRYYGSGTWGLTTVPQVPIPTTSSYVGDTSGLFTGVDVTYAGDYNLVITDRNNSKTTLPIIVGPSTLAQTLDASANLIHSVCTNNPTLSICPLSATTYTVLGTNVVADGSDHYTVTIKPRDRYGNIVNAGSIDISYTGTVSSQQIPSNTFSPYIATNLHDGLIFSEPFTISFDGNWSYHHTPLTGVDITYTIASVAPTDGVENILKLNQITYTSPSGGMSTLPPDPTELSFIPAVTSTITGPTTIKVNEENTFTNTVTKTGLPGITPDIFSFLVIGDGTNASFRDFRSDSTIDCQGYQYPLGIFNSPDSACYWTMIDNHIYPSVLKIAANSNFSFSGVYASFVAHPIQEPVSYTTFVHYDVLGLGLINYYGSSDVVYPSQSASLGTSEFHAQKVKILGQNNALGEYGTIGTNGTTRAQLIDTIRKNATVLSRNRSDFSNAPYTIVHGNLSIGNADFADKRTIVVIGGDITIIENIVSHDHPLAIIALSSPSGGSGNIFIDPGVTDIHASLIAEHSVLSTDSSQNDRQLYIHGSVISANTLGDTLAGICPYYVTTCGPTEAAKYDLENLRSGYDGTNPSSSSTAQTYSSVGLVIEYDMGVERDPPPILH